MTETKVMSIALKVLGVYSIIRAIEQLRTAANGFIGWSTFSLISSLGNMMAHLLPLMLLLTAAFVLLRYSETLAQKLFPTGEPSVVVIENPGKEWYALILTVIGVILLIWTVPQYLSALLVTLSLRYSLNDPALSAQVIAGIWVVAVQLVLLTTIGLYLVFRSKRIAEMLRKLPKG